MRIVIGEDEALLRAGLSHVLERGGFDVVAAASDADELVQAVELHRPELLVTDIRMPPSHADEGLRAALDIRRSHPTLPVVVLSQHLQRRYAIELLASRLGGWATSGSSASVIHAFCADLGRVYDGGSVLDPEVVALMVARARTGQTLSADSHRAATSTGAYGRRPEQRRDRPLPICVRAGGGPAHLPHLRRARSPPSEDDHRRVLAVVRFLSS